MPPQQHGVSLTDAPSPIAAELVAVAGSSTLSELRAVPNGGGGGGGVCYCRRDPANQGRTCLQSIRATAAAKGEPAVVTTTTHTGPFRRGTAGSDDVTTTNVRSAVHEYGGGAYCVYNSSNSDSSEAHGESFGLIYTDFPSHTLYHQKPGDNSNATVIASVPHCRFADFSVLESTGGGTNGVPLLLLAVMEDHTHPAPATVVNSIVTVSLDGRGTVETVAAGHDFYASPCRDGGGRTATARRRPRVAYVAWDHPRMPWDSTGLYVQDGTAARDRAGDAPPAAVPVTCVHAGASVYAPQWWDGQLYYLSNVSGWYNLYRWDDNGAASDDASCAGSSGTSTPLYPVEADFSEPACGWTLGVQCYTFLRNGTLVATYTPAAAAQDRRNGGSVVVLIDTKTGAVAHREFGRSCLPPTSIWSLTASGGGDGNDALYFLGGSTTAPVGLWCWPRPGDAACIAAEVVSSVPRDPTDPAAATATTTTILPFFSEPRHIQFPSHPTLGVGFAFAYYYPPVAQSPSSAAATKPPPPLLVKAHGGPTARTSTTFRLDIQFWTSRGFAVLDVDYGGSSGYGRAYQQSLRNHWGLLDVADVCYGAKYCVDKGWANPDYLCIDGKSAGGYTTLAALTFADTFRAGASLYGVGDLSALAEDTHKFESRYLDGLVGPYPEAKTIFDERCPILHPDRINCPVILLQGDEDKIVPPNQAETMFEVLTSKGLPSALVIYKGEQHGFRKSDNVTHSLLSEYYFFSQSFGFEPQQEGNFPGVRVGERVVVK